MNLNKEFIQDLLSILPRVTAQNLFVHHRTGGVSPVSRGNVIKIWLEHESQTVNENTDFENLNNLDLIFESDAGDVGKISFRFIYAIEIKTISKAEDFKEYKFDSDKQISKKIIRNSKEDKYLHIYLQSIG